MNRDDFWRIAEEELDQALEQLEHERKLETIERAEEEFYETWGWEKGTRVSCSPGGPGVYVGHRQYRKAPATHDEDFENDLQEPEEGRFINPLIRLDSGGYIWGVDTAWRPV